MIDEEGRGEEEEGRGREVEWYCGMREGADEGEEVTVTLRGGLGLVGRQGRSKQTTKRRL